MTSFLLREVEDGLGRVVNENELAVRDGVMVVTDVLGPRVDIEVDEAQVVSGEQLLAALDDVKHLVDRPRRRLVVPQDYVDVEDGDVLLVRTVLGALSMSYELNTVQGDGAACAKPPFDRMLCTSCSVTL